MGLGCSKMNTVQSINGSTRSYGDPESSPFLLPGTSVTITYRRPTENDGPLPRPCEKIIRDYEPLFIPVIHPRIASYQKRIQETVSLGRTMKELRIVTRTTITFQKRRRAGSTTPSL